QRHFDLGNRFRKRKRTVQCPHPVSGSQNWIRERIRPPGTGFQRIGRPAGSHFLFLHRVDTLVQFLLIPRRRSWLAALVLAAIVMPLVPACAAPKDRTAPPPDLWVMSL